jgi:hypothetical protein
MVYIYGTGQPYLWCKLFITCCLRLPHQDRSPVNILWLFMLYTNNIIAACAHLIGMGFQNKNKNKLHRQWTPLPTLHKEKEPFWYRVPWNSTTKKNKKMITGIRRVAGLTWNQLPMKVDNSVGYSTFVLDKFGSVVNLDVQSGLIIIQSHQCIVTSVVHLTLDGVNGKWRWRRNLHTHTHTRNLCQIDDENSKLRRQSSEFSDGNAVIYDLYLRCHFWMTPYVHNTNRD